MKLRSAGWRSAVSLAIGFAGLGPATAQSPELYGTRLQVGCCRRLERINLQSGQPVGGWSYTGGSIDHWALTVHTDRFVSVNTTWPLDRVVTIHPANGVRTEAPLTGIGVFDAHKSLVSAPPTNTLYFASKTTLFTLDPTSGQGALVGNFTGSPYSWDIVTCMAMDASGDTYALGYHDGAQRYAVYTVDLSTAQLTWVGEIVMPGGGGYFLDLAIPSSGDWWASFNDDLVLSHRGLWRITPGSFQATQVLTVDPPYYGLAFLPPTQQSSHCTAKPNSLGCSPSISGEGFPSPTAWSGYTIRASNVRSVTNGVLQFGVGGRAAAPFAGGVLCTAGPVRRTAVQSSGGLVGASPDCSGQWEVDFNSWMSLNTALPAGVTMQAQWLGRDGGFAPPDNWTLSDALEFTLRP